MMALIIIGKILMHTNNPIKGYTGLAIFALGLNIPCIFIFVFICRNFQSFRRYLIENKGLKNVLKQRFSKKN
jgi:cytochrome c biogenesis protein CcdA